MQTQEGYTAMHYASFQGELELIRYIEQLGADISIKSNQ